jgi:hypothetical protein
MLRYVLNETINKTSDFLKLNKNTSSSSSAAAATTTTTTTDTVLDFNNNNLNHQPSRSSESKLTSTAAHLHHHRQLDSTKIKSESLIDEFDWFKPFHDLVELTADPPASTAPTSTAHVDSVQLTAVLQLDKQQSDRQILFSLYYDRLIKLYSINSRNTKYERQKMNSYLSGLSLNPESLEEDVRSFYEVSKQQKNSDDLDLPETVKLFQKSYYKEPIKGELVNVPSWRMKEKVTFFFLYFIELTKLNY